MRRSCVLVLGMLLVLVACQPGETPTATMPPVPTVTPLPTVEPTKEPVGTILLIFGDRFIHEIYVVEIPAFEEAGYQVVVASNTLKPLHAKESDLTVEPDLLLRDVQVADYDAIIFNCDNDISFGGGLPHTDRIAQEAVQQRKVLGAICSGPRSLGHAGVLKGIRATAPSSGPASCQFLEDEYGAICTGAFVERDGLIITGKDRWASKTFAEAILDALSESSPAPSAGAVKATPVLPTPTPANKLGDTWTRPADGAVMVYVPAGEFVMGTTYEQGKYTQELCKKYSGANAIVTCGRAVAIANEKPAHPVALDGFWIDRTEVTNGQYQRCVAAGACFPPAETGSYTRESYYGDPTYDDYPVVWITQWQAADYCAWAGGQLPTEAQWEYAARGPESRLFPWGDVFDGTRLNYCDANCTAGETDPTGNDGYADTAPVGSFPAGVSWCGALDLAGNVREWVADWFGYYTAERQVNPTGPSTGTTRIPRGGSWLDRPDDVRSTNRGENTTDYTRHKVGFRCALCESTTQH